jgi:ketosteroid isomerase-like protein
MNAIEQAVWDVILAFNDAFEKNDVERYFSYMDENLVVITPSNPYRIVGIPLDREGFEYYLKLGAGRVNFFQNLEPHFFINGDTAVVSYYTRGSYGVDAGIKTAYYKETDVLVKRGESWKIVHIHVSATSH